MAGGRTLCKSFLGRMVGGDIDPVGTGVLFHIGSRAKEKDAHEGQGSADHVGRDLFLDVEVHESSGHQIGFDNGNAKRGEQREPQNLKHGTHDRDDEEHAQQSPYLHVVDGWMDVFTAVVT